MTDLLERAVAVTRELPTDLQDEIARLMLSLAGEEQPVVQLTIEEEASFVAALEEVDRSDFATEDEVRAVWAKYEP